MVCKVQESESLHLQVMVTRSESVVFPRGLPEVSSGDPRGEISPLAVEEMACIGCLLGGAGGLERASGRSEGFPLDLQTFEARISLRINDLPPVSAKVFGKRGVPGVRWPVA